MFGKQLMKNLFFDEVMDKQEDIRRMSVMKSAKLTNQTDILNLMF